MQIGLGFLLLFVGGELLVRSAVIIAEKLQISKLLIGITVVAYGTSAPELLITINALLAGSSEIAFGNVVGSNIANIFLVLGLASLVYPIKMERKLVKFDMLFLVMATFIMLLFISDHNIELYEAALFIIILVLYTYLTYKVSTKSEEHDVLEDQVDEVSEQLNIKTNSFYAIAILVAGVVALAYGASILVEGASALALKYGVSEATIAVTIVAIGGSAPEIVTSLVSSFKKHSDIAIGNVVGSNLFNILGVLGIAGFFKEFSFSSDSTLIIFDIWVVFIATLLLFIISSFKRKLSRRHGLLFVICYSSYIFWQILVY